MLFLVTCVSSVSAYYASGNDLGGNPKLWGMLFLAQLPLLGLGLFFLNRKDKLKPTLMPKPGDIQYAFLLTVVLVIAIWAGRALLMPHGSPREAWLARLYIQLGDPVELGKPWWVWLAIMGWAAADEMVWRGWLQPIAIGRWGTAKGVAISALAYSVQGLPVAYQLRDPVAGQNPLVWLLALCCGLVWGYITQLNHGRIFPSVISHAALAYFTVLEFRPGL